MLHLNCPSGRLVKSKPSLDGHSHIPSNPVNQPHADTATTVKVVIQISGLRNATRNLALELGLGESTVTELGDIWRQLCETWVAAEIALEKGGGPKPIELHARQLSVPVALRQWGLKIRGVQTEHIDTVEIGSSMLQWWNGLKNDFQLDVNELVKKDWCVAGPSGVLLLVMGMKLWGLMLDKDARAIHWTPVVLDMIEGLQKIPTAEAL